ncbi:MAG: ABC transporter permease [Acidimicrobiales bacterium]|nr:ABC transporter permease [Acidimicrobiales bacterium]
MIGLTLQRREQPLPGGQVRAVLAGAFIALLAGAVLLLLSGSNPVDVYLRMADAAFGSERAWSNTLSRAVPLGLAGLAVAVAGSMGLWNIGAEGQIIAGAIGGAWVARVLPDADGVILIPAMLIGAVIGGGLLAVIPAVLRAQLGVNEIITTLMLNEVILRVVRYLVNGIWKDPGGSGFPQAPLLPDQSALPGLFGRANIGLLIAAAVLIGFGYFASRSKWGYELRLAGSSEKTAEYAGISLRTKIMTVLTLSGAIAGLAGGIELTGSSSRLVEGVANGWGFAGIIVAALALMRPSGVALVAVFFGAVQVGGLAIQVSGVSASIANILQAMILFGALAAGVFTEYKLVRSSRSPRAAVAA